MREEAGISSRTRSVPRFVTSEKGIDQSPSRSSNLEVIQAGNQLFAHTGVFRCSCN